MLIRLGKHLTLDTNLRRTKLPGLVFTLVIIVDLLIVSPEILRRNVGHVYFEVR
jgi:hypothetical protein